MDKSLQISRWIQHGGKKTFGKLFLLDTIVSTYSVTLAVVDRSAQVVHLNTHHYSVTSSRHRTLIIQGANAANYRVTEYETEHDLLTRSYNRIHNPKS